MDFGSATTYAFEIWSPSGVALADISRLVQNRKIVLERNEAEIITFDLDLTAFEQFCEGINVDPKTLLFPLQTHLRIKRAGQYWIGAEIVDAHVSVPVSGGAITTGAMSPTTELQETISVTATGYLNLFIKRDLTLTYSAQESVSIACDLLTQTQALTNGNVGVTIPGGQYSTAVNRNESYVQQNVKQAIQDLSNLPDGLFDFIFTYDKKFMTYAQIGSVRNDVSFVYGGAASNVIGFDLDRDGTSVANEIIGMGSGLPPSQLTTTQDDSASQLQNYLRQDIKQYNTVTDATVLAASADADLAMEKDVLAIPQITISGKELVGVPFLEIGDTIPVSTVNHPYLSDIDGAYRIEKMEIDIDDNDFEQAIGLWFDNSGSKRIDRLTDYRLVNTISRLRSDLDHAKS